MDFKQGFEGQGESTEYAPLRYELGKQLLVQCTATQYCG